MDTRITHFLLKQWLSDLVSNVMKQQFGRVVLTDKQQNCSSLLCVTQANIDAHGAERKRQYNGPGYSRICKLYYRFYSEETNVMIGVFHKTILSGTSLARGSQRLGRYCKQGQTRPNKKCQAETIVSISDYFLCKVSKFL